MKGKRGKKQTNPGVLLTNLTTTKLSRIRSPQTSGRTCVHKWGMRCKVHPELYLPTTPNPQGIDWPNYWWWPLGVLWYWGEPLVCCGWLLSILWYWGEPLVWMTIGYTVVLRWAIGMLWLTTGRAVVLRMTVICWSALGGWDSVSQVQMTLRRRTRNQEKNSVYFKNQQSTPLDAYSILNPDKNGILEHFSIESILRPKLK